jgi:hypothetical protein
MMDETYLMEGVKEALCFVSRCFVGEQGSSAILSAGLQSAATYRQASGLERCG